MDTVKLAEAAKKTVSSPFGGTNEPVLEHCRADIRLVSKLTG